MTFPSPIGELHFSIVLFATLGIFLWIVSVPYRGATFLNEVFEQIQSDDKVSVPYRGATFLNESKFSVMSSPKTVSVPYRGATFLNRLNRLINQLHRFPSPIGELHFSILSLAQLIL